MVVRWMDNFVRSLYLCTLIACTNSHMGIEGAGTKTDAIESIPIVAETHQELMQLETFYVEKQCHSSNTVSQRAYLSTQKSGVLEWRNVLFQGVNCQIPNIAQRFTYELDREVLDGIKGESWDLRVADFELAYWQAISLMSQQCGLQFEVGEYLSVVGTVCQSASLRDVSYVAKVKNGNLFLKAVDTGYEREFVRTLSLPY